MPCNPVARFPRVPDEYVGHCLALMALVSRDRSEDAAASVQEAQGM